MTTQSRGSWAKPTFTDLIRLRKEWKEFHEKQDRENADRVFRSAGVELITDPDLKLFPPLFREKLDEFGRDWERPIAVAALREGYVIYRGELLIGVEKVTELHHWIETLLNEKLPGGAIRGAPLFFESNGLHALKDGTWDALFYFALHPSVTPESLMFETAPSVKATPLFLRIA